MREGFTSSKGSQLDLQSQSGSYTMLLVRGRTARSSQLTTFTFDAFADECSGLPFVSHSLPAESR